MGLNPQQARGRHIYDQRCGMCHEAYSSRNLKGPSLEKVFRRRSLTNGMPANDERVCEIIVVGRSKMNGFGQVLTSDQVDDLMAYLHTL